MEYAELRAHAEWKMVAAASTGSVNAFRDTGVEHGPPCSRDSSPYMRPDWSPPQLDEMHVHRLQLEYPDLYDRLQQLAGALPVFQERVIAPISIQLMKSLLGVEYPAELRTVWKTWEAGGESSSETWARYAAKAHEVFLFAGVNRPGLIPDTFVHSGESAEDDAYEMTQRNLQQQYRTVWLIARVMEHIAGWAARPLPLPDMVYAAAAVGNDDILAQLEPSLSAIEDELKCS